MFLRCNEKQKLSLALLALGVSAAAACSVKESGLAQTQTGGAGGGVVPSGGTGGGSATRGSGGQATGGAPGDAAPTPDDDGGKLEAPLGAGGVPATGGVLGPDGGQDRWRDSADREPVGGSDGALSTGGMPTTGGTPATGGMSGAGGGGTGGTVVPDGSPEVATDVADARRETREGPPDRFPDRPRPEDVARDNPPDKPFVESDGSYQSDVPTGEAGLPLVLAWSDEFSGAANTGVDVGKWTYVTWGPGSGGVNNELQQYTNSTNNVFLDGSGHLVIRAQHNPAAASPYTSGRIETSGKVYFGPGYHIEVRATLPAGRGSFPGILLRGTAETWPDSGALGLVEQYGQDKSWFYATAYAPDVAGSGRTDKTRYTFPDAITASADFHVYSLDWYWDRLVFQVDGQTILTSSYAPSSPFYSIAEYFVLDVALGGDMGGTIDDSAFPMEMMVDYVRVYVLD